MNNPKNNRPKVGLAVLIIKDGKILWGKRKNAHGDGTWCFPGGHLEYQESFEDCARRETMEETGMTIKNLRFATITNDIFKKEEKHYITIFMLADYDQGKVKICEPEKCERWEWFSWDNPPQPMFLPEVNLYAMNFDPFE